MKPVVRAQRLSKRYLIQRAGNPQYRTLREAFMGAMTAPWRKVRKRLSPRRDGNGFAMPPNHSSSAEPFYALRDVSFEISAGDVVGVIGRNGAGKSTLLKILSRITEPTSGRVELRGRIGSLLEVGTGFHSELTGRENIYLNGAILGMSHREIARKFDEIVAFAEIGPFLETPVKRYSSGMYVRLAFAVAAHLDPEILLVDEVLAVGDLAFQKKCLGKMGDIAGSGRTIIFVSHNMATVQHLCEKVLVLVRGRPTYFGATEEGIRHYTESTFVPPLASATHTLQTYRRPGSVPLLGAVRLVGMDGAPRERFACGESLRIEIDVNPVVPLGRPQFGIGVDDWIGARVFSLTTYLSDSELPALHEPSTIVCSVADLPLVPGRYVLSLSAGTPESPLLDALDQAVWFDVEPADFFGNGKCPGPSLGKVLMRSSWSKADRCSRD
jgi:lipopolysaccharide transport system ATP-binding protein